MKAIILIRTDPIEKKPLQMQEIATPTPGPGEILLQVSACEFADPTFT
jgi:NADPH:quinone reductase-like Zn-dependent oxidoreductase